MHSNLAILANFFHGYVRQNKDVLGPPIVKRTPALRQPDANSDMWPKTTIALTNLVASVPEADGSPFGWRLDRTFASLLALGPATEGVFGASVLRGGSKWTYASSPDASNL